jgi:hypothetical protein
MDNLPKNNIDSANKDNGTADPFAFWVEEDKTYLEEWEETRKYFNE